MNTQLAFAFGMLTMVALTMLVAIVIGLVKAVRQGKQIEALNHELSDFIARVERSPALTDLDREINLRIDNDVQHIHNRINDVQSTTDSRFDKTENRIAQRLDSMYDRIDYIEELLKANGITTTLVKPLTAREIEKHTGKQILKG